MRRPSGDRRSLLCGSMPKLRARPRLFALDVDGTLLASDHRVTEATKAAVDHVRSRGVEVVLATSRGPRALEPVLRTLQLTEPAVFVGSQGAITGSYTPTGDLRVLAQEPAPLDRAKRFVRSALAVGFSVHWFTGPNWYVSHLDHTVEAEIREVDAIPEVRNLLDETRGPDKLMLISPTDDVTALRSLAACLPEGLVAQVSNPNFLEITRTDVHKGAAVRKYCESNGIWPADVIAIGDGPNDLSLFKFAGTSIAPANARAEILEAATLITMSNDEDGVAHALTTLVP